MLLDSKAQDVFQEVMAALCSHSEILEVAKARDKRLACANTACVRRRW